MKKRYCFVFKGMGPELEWKEVCRSETFPSSELNDAKKDAEKIREELIAQTFKGSTEGTIGFSECQFQIKHFWGLKLTIEEV